jgi:hypothetical protein
VIEGALLREEELAKRIMKAQTPGPVLITVVGTLHTDWAAVDTVMMYSPAEVSVLAHVAYFK